METCITQRPYRKSSNTLSNILLNNALFRIIYTRLPSYIPDDTVP